MSPALIEDVDLVVCDLDGVVYAGPAAVPHAIEELGALDIPVIYATNNASRTPTEVADHLNRLGLSSPESAVITSSVVGGRILAQALPAGAAVLAIGGEGVTAGLEAAGLRPVAPEAHRAGETVVAVMQGYGPDVTASDLAEAAFAIQAGARWVATNADRTLPTDRGLAPGNGSLVAAVGAAADRDPEVVGKPEPPMYLAAAQQMGVASSRVLGVGDRLETDIEGANAAGCRSALVLTGVHGLADAAAATGNRRPDHLLLDLRDLRLPYPSSQVDGDGWHGRAEAAARLTSGGLEVRGEGVDLMRAVVDCLWHAVDEGDLDSAAAREAAAGWESTR